MRCTDPTKHPLEWFVKTSRTVVVVNDKGQLIGESHPGAVLTDAEVDLVLALRAERFSYGWLAAKFEVSKSCIAKICTGKTRAQIGVAIRRVSGPRRIS